MDRRKEGLSVDDSLLRKLLLKKILEKNGLRGLLRENGGHISPLVIYGQFDFSSQRAW